MLTRQFTGNPSQVMIEQLAASGVKYVFYNSGSREAMFFDALHGHPDVQGILALHEGPVAAMAGGTHRSRAIRPSWWSISGPGWRSHSANCSTHGTGGCPLS